MSESPIAVHRGVAVLIASALLLGGAAATYVFMTQPSEQTARVVASEQGFQPAKIALRAGIPARITFLRTSDKTCATEVVFPSLNIKRDLPLNEPVVIEFTPKTKGDIGFACGMKMIRGVVAVE